MLYILIIFNFFLIIFFSRLRLYSVLEVLREDVLYFDTDSIIFIGSSDINKIPVKTGLGLGDLCDEMPSPDVFITEWCCGGPKNYDSAGLMGFVKWSLKG